MAIRAIGRNCASIAVSFCAAWHSGSAPAARNRSIQAGAQQDVTADGSQASLFRRSGRDGEEFVRSGTEHLPEHGGVACPRQLEDPTEQAGCLAEQDETEAEPEMTAPECGIAGGRELEIRRDGRVELVPGVTLGHHADDPVDALIGQLDRRRGRAGDHTQRDRQPCRPP